MVYTKEEFKRLWESEDYCPITFDDCADCVVSWGICDKPKTRDIAHVRYLAVKGAGCNDAEDYNPFTEEE